jgi:hypothetical protein
VAPRAGSQRQEQLGGWSARGRDSKR